MWKWHTIAILTAVGMIACPNAQAEVGDRFEESVEKHGEPMGKLVMKNQVAYMFASDDLLVREVYDLEGICIESGFLSSVKLSKESIAAKIIPGALSEAAPATWSKWWFLLLLFPTSGLIGSIIWYVIRRKKNATPKEAIPLEGGPELETSVEPPNPQTSEVSLMLSRNEMCFYRALSKAVQGEYIVTFHILLERIIDFESPDFAEYAPVFDELKPISVDFVLHHLEDTSVSAVILLTTEKTILEQKTKRVKFIQNIMRKNETPVIQIPENYKYDSGKVMNVIQNATQRCAA